MNLSIFRIAHFSLILACALPMEAVFGGNQRQRRAMKAKGARLSRNSANQMKREPMQAKPEIVRTVTAKTSDLMQDVRLNPMASSIREDISKARGAGVPSYDVSFLAADYRETDQYGTCAEGAAGSTQFLLGCKGRIRTFDKTTGLPDGVLNLSMDRFFSPILNEGMCTDLDCVYDSISNRWYISCDGSWANPSCGIKLAISDGDPITAETVWTYLIVDYTSNPGFEFYPVLAFFDYTTLGFDQNYIYCAADIFQDYDSVNSNPLYFSSAIYAIQKSSAFSGGPVTVYPFRNLVNQDTASGPVVQFPVINYDTSVNGPNNAFVVGTNQLDFFNNDSFQIALTVIDLTTMILTFTSIAVDEYVGTIPVQPLGTPSSHLVDPNVGFTQSVAHIRDNQLFMLHGVGTDATGASTAETNVDRNSIRYYQACVSDPSAPILKNSGSLFDSSGAQISYLTPSWMSNGAGQLILGSTQCSPTTYLDAIIAQVNPSTFVPSTVVPFTQSTSSYYATEDWEFAPHARWGDHTRVSPDPDGTTFWACQFWCSDTDTWGIQVAHATAN